MARKLGIITICPPGALKGQCAGCYDLLFPQNTSDLVRAVPLNGEPEKKAY